LRLIFFALWRAILAALIALVLARIDAYVEEHHGENLAGRAWRTYRDRGGKRVRRETPPDAGTAIDTQGRPREALLSRQCRSRSSTWTACSIAVRTCCPTRASRSTACDEPAGACTSRRTTPLPRAMTTFVASPISVSAGNATRSSRARTRRRTTSSGASRGRTTLSALAGMGSARGSA